MRVWRADLSRTDEWLDGDATALLGAGEAARIGGERDEVWRRRTASRAALSVALGEHLDRPPGSLAFGEGASGKPELLAPDDGDGDGAFFSLSRSGDLCLIAISAEGPVGVDVEAVREVPELEGLARSRLAASEAAAILELPEERRLRAFHRCWTRKEAFLKATGTGIGAGLDSVAVSVGERPALASAPGADPGDWVLLDLELGERFAAALALRSAEKKFLNPLVPLSLSVRT